MRRFITHIVLFLVLYMVVSGIYRSLLPKYWPNEMLELKLDYLEDHASQYNTVFLGSSKVYRHVDPALFDSLDPEGETSSFNLGTAGLFSPESVVVLDHLIDQSEKYGIDRLFVQFQGISNLADKNLHAQRMKYPLSPGLMPSVFSTLKTEDKSDQMYNYFFSFLENMFSIGYFKDWYRGLNEVRKESRIGLDDLVIENDGFLSLDDELNYMVLQADKRGKGLLKRKATATKKKKAKKIKKLNAEEHQVLNEIYQTMYHSLDKKAKNKGLELFYFFMPEDFVKSESLDFDNALLWELDEVGQFKSLTNKFDKGHYNEDGAQLMTTLLANKYYSERN